MELKEKVKTHNVYVYAYFITFQLQMIALKEGKIPQHIKIFQELSIIYVFDIDLKPNPDLWKLRMP